MIATIALIISIIALSAAIGFIHSQDTTVSTMTRESYDLSDKIRALEEYFNLECDYQHDRVYRKIKKEKK